MNPTALAPPLTLTVIYDDRCNLCQRCRAWLERSAQIVSLGFVAASNTEAVRRLGVDPTLVPVGDELVVVGHTAAGEPEPVWVGPDAFITCLWALADHRDLSATLQKPAMRPIAKRAFHALSLGRGSISALLKDNGNTVDEASEPACSVCTSEDDR